MAHRKYDFNVGATTTRHDDDDDDDFSDEFSEAASNKSLGYYLDSSDEDLATSKTSSSCSKKHSQSEESVKSSEISYLDHFKKLCLESQEERLKAMEESPFKASFMQTVTGNFQKTVETNLIDESIEDRVVEVDNLLREGQLNKDSNIKYQLMKRKREQLPTQKMKNQILQFISENQVVLISGETGCGKTTQVSQIILDDYIMDGKGSTCHVVCTQPRRISAISVAQRVADERAEELCRSVGYQIRLDSKLPPKRGSILYCTTGILLHFMRSDPSLNRISHLIVDEVHERDLLSDFVLCVIKQILHKRPKLKVILMSATINDKEFCNYFKCPVLNIPGSTFPVEDLYLENVLSITGVVHSAVTNSKWKNTEQVYKKRDEYQKLILPYIRTLEWKKIYSANVIEHLKSENSEDINLNLIASLVFHIHENQKEGAILIFLPGWDKIESLYDIITGSLHYQESSFLILTLHSSMPTISQNEVFDRPPKGVRKVVISTNIAETSVTIEDVVYVIDSGIMKIKNFDIKNNISTLQEEWISLANLMQRRGRAGRVQPGICYHLYTKARRDSFQDFVLPEMQRSRLENVILEVKMLQLGKIQEFLGGVINPPDPKTVEISTKYLERINALDQNEDITPLGYHLAWLPVDPQIGKMILMGALFSCLDPVLTIAASLGFKDAFVNPIKKQDLVDQVKMDLDDGDRSDHLITLKAMQKWYKARNKKRAKDFCGSHFLHHATLINLSDMKSQFAEMLYDMKFLRSKSPTDQAANLNSKNIDLVRALICTGLYPNVAEFRGLSLVKRGIRHGQNNLVFETAEDGKVKIHPRSVISKYVDFKSSLFVYFKKMKTSAIFMHDATMVYPLGLLLFGEDIKNKSDFLGSVSVNMGALTFRGSSSSMNLVLELRKKLNWLLQNKVTNPGVVNFNPNSFEGAVLRAIIELIDNENSSDVEKRMGISASITANSLESLYRLLL